MGVCSWIAKRTEIVRFYAPASKPDLSGAQAHGGRGERAMVRLGHDFGNHED